MRWNVYLLAVYCNATDLPSVPSGGSLVIDGVEFIEGSDKNQEYLTKHRWDSRECYFCLYTVDLNLNTLKHWIEIHYKPSSISATNADPPECSWPMTAPPTPGRTTLASGINLGFHEKNLIHVSGINASNLRIRQKERTSKYSDGTEVCLKRFFLSSMPRWFYSGFVLIASLPDKW